jgi:hypothetical protein
MPTTDGFIFATTSTNSAFAGIIYSMLKTDNKINAFFNILFFQSLYSILNIIPFGFHPWAKF